MLFKARTTYLNPNVFYAAYISKYVLKIKMMEARSMNRREAKLQAMSLACVLLL